jgi:hypothetical protein
MEYSINHDIYDEVFGNNVMDEMGLLLKVLSDGASNEVFI